jgi:hypothetical protein
MALAKLLHVEKQYQFGQVRYGIVIEGNGERFWPKLSQLIETQIRNLEKPEPDEQPKPSRQQAMSKPLEALIKTPVRSARKAPGARSHEEAEEIPE